jgi:hypothetical protein
LPLPGAASPSAWQLLILSRRLNRLRILRLRFKHKRLEAVNRAISDGKMYAENVKTPYTVDRKTSMVHERHMAKFISILFQGIEWITHKVSPN